MPSTEFLLYLAVSIFAVFFIITYYREYSDPEIQYRYIPIYQTDSSEKSRKSNKQESQTYCNNPQCKRMGRCMCRGMTSMVSQETGFIGETPLGGPIGGPLVGPNPGPTPAPVPTPPIDPLRKFDYDAVNDEFTPPFRRSYYDEFNYVLHPGLYPTYTRGPMGRFRKVGTLVAEGVGANDKYKFLNVMGRQKYTGREYEYYATTIDTERGIKFYIETKGKEINDGDIITITKLDGYKFRFEEDPDLSPRYDPYLI